MMERRNGAKKAPKAKVVVEAREEHPAATIITLLNKAIKAENKEWNQAQHAKNT
jgi:hypothetical protein